MKTKSLTFILLILGVSQVCLWAQEEENPPVTLQKVVENVYQTLGGKGSNGGVIIGESAVLVIDAKMDEKSVKQNIEAIAQITDLPIKYLVNTHSDGDHILGNRYFPSTVTVVAHENCRKDFFKENFGRESDWDQPEFYPFAPSLTFKKNMNLWLGRDLIELHYFGVGHTTGDIVVYYPEKKIAFLGDQYFGGRPQLIHSIKDGNSFAYVRTMTLMLETLDAEYFLSGHNDAVGRSEIKEHIQAMILRQKKVKELKSQDLTLAQVLDEFEKNESRLVTSIFNEIGSQ